MTKENLENIKTRADIKKIQAESQKCTIDTEISKVTELRQVLTSHYIDDDRSILGSEPFFMPIVTGANRDIVLNKLIEIIKKF